MSQSQTLENSSPVINAVFAFVKLSRLPFLLGGILMFTLGASVARPIDVVAYLWAQMMVTAAQITAHYVNEYADYEADKAIANRTAFSGGSGVLSTGMLPRSVALRAGQITTIVALVAAVMITQFSVAAAIAGVLALAVSWTYSMPPFRLLNTGFGEFATALTVAGLVPAIGALSQNNGLPAQLWWMIAILVPMQFGMLLAFELPDLKTDRVVGKRVLGVRLGSEHTLVIIWLSVLATSTVGLAGYLTGHVGWATAICLPTAAVMLLSAHRRQYGRTTFCAVASFFLLGVGLLIGTI